jgi:UDP-N-acetylglucosamine enolpyruvyl transferase
MIITDMMEAGTYMIAAAATAGGYCFQECYSTHLERYCKLREMGLEVN